MKSAVIVVWVGIAICFIRGLYALDMGGSAQHTYPTAVGLCLAGSVVAAAIMMVFHAMTSKAGR